MRTENKILGTFTGVDTGSEKSVRSGKFNIEAYSENNGGTFTSATIDILCKLAPGAPFKSIGLIALSGDADSDSISVDAKYAFIRADVTDFSGTGSVPQVIVTMRE